MNFKESNLIFKDPPDAGGLDLPGVPAGPPPGAESAPPPPAVDPEAARREAELEATRAKHVGEKVGSAKDFKEAREALNVPRFGAILRDQEILAYQWGRESKSDVESMWKDWGKLRLDLGNPFYTKLKATLLRPFSDTNVTRKPRDGSVMGSLDFYTNPFKQDHMDWLESHDKTYLDAVQYVEEVRSLLVDRMKEGEKLTKLKQKVNKDPVFKEVTEHVHNIGKDFARSWREKDYTSLAMYGIAAWSIFGIAKKMKSAGNGKYYNYLMYAAAGYTGYHVLKRGGLDLGEKLGMTDETADVEGSVLAHMAGVDIEGGGTMDGALLLAVSEVPVKTMHQLYKKAEDGVIHPADLPEIFGKLKKYRPRDINNPKTHNQRIYVETGRKLFGIMKGTIQMYDEIPGKKKTFEEQFVNVRDDIRFSDLAYYMSKYYDPAKKEKWWKRGDTIKTALKDLKVLDGKLDFHIDEVIKGGNYKGYIRGVPVVFAASADGKFYSVRFYDSDTPNTAAFGKIPTKVGRGLNVAIKSVKSKVDARMLTLVNKLTLDKSGKAIDLQYDGEWTAEIDTGGSSEFGLKDGKRRVAFRPLENGQGVEVEMGGMRIPVNFAIEGTHPYKLPLIQELIHSNDDYREFLLPFVRGGQLEFKDPKEGDGSFELVVAGITDPTYQLIVNVKVSEDPTNPDNKKREYIIDENSIARLLSRREFARKYAKAVETTPRVESTFRNFKSVLKGAPESFVMHFVKSIPGWFTGATKANILRGMKLSNLTGSISDNKANAILDARRNMLRSSLEVAVSGAKNLQQLRNARGQIYDVGIFNLDFLVDKFRHLNIEKYRKGEDWDAEEFNKEIIEPLSRTGAKSREYADRLSRFQSDLWGFLFNDADFSRKGHNIASEVLVVFAHYTAGLDAELDLSQLNLGLIDREPKNETERVEKERAVKGWKALKYMGLVHTTLIAKVKEKRAHLEVSVPPGRDRGFWGVPTFDEYETNPGRYNSLAGDIDVADNSLPKAHGDEHYIYFEDHEALSEEAADGEKSPKAKEKREVIYRGRVLPKAPESYSVDEKKAFGKRLREAVGTRTELDRLYVAEFNRQMSKVKKYFGKYVKRQALRQLERDHLNATISFRDFGTNLAFKFRDSIIYPPQSPKDEREMGTLRKAATADLNVDAAEGAATRRPQMFFRPADMWSEVDFIHETLKMSGATVTEGAQKNLIAERVARIIEIQVLMDDSVLDKYVRDHGWLDKLRSKYHDFKLWLKTP